MPIFFPADHRSHRAGFSARPRAAELRSFAAAFALCLLSLAAQAASLPRLEGKDLNGAKQNLSSLRGKIVVLSFWATWCAPCQEELPRLSLLAKRYAGQDVEFVAVSIDEPKDRAKIQPFLDRHAIGLNVWTGPNADILDRFGLRNIVPGTVVLDRQGQPVTRIMGEARDEDVQTPVDWLLMSGKGEAPKPIIKRY